MPQTFTINEDQVNTVAKKAIYKLIRIFIVVILFTTLPSLISGDKDILIRLMSSAFTTVMFIFVAFWAYKRAKKTFADLKITTDEFGVDFKAVMAPYKRIEWAKLGYKEKKNGSITIFDKTIAPITRWWLGSGVIFVPFEIDNRWQLIQELDNHINALTTQN
jgi:hypothetical protein